MSLSMLPDAIQLERINMLKSGIETLKTMGNDEFAVQDLAGFREPDELIVPVLNTHVQPDIQAKQPDTGSETLAVVEVSSDLGDESCGRRWQALEAWALLHDAQMMVFVHPEDQTRALGIARAWHVPDDYIVTLPRLH
ncbi:hypothetical protein ACFDAU_15995 [Sulfuriferula sp. GW1]|uniref:hypothetical protein n=1 Tax=Sulfuriferula sp. GW1 TaxID=3345111 RepID=UPI0039AE9F6E